jgi:hypothetical protein
MGAANLDGGCTHGGWRVMACDLLRQKTIASNSEHAATPTSRESYIIRLRFEEIMAVANFVATLESRSKSPDIY